MQAVEGWITVGLYTTLIFTLSSIPNLSPPAAGLGTDKLCHLVEYGGWGLLIRRALERVIRPAPAGFNATVAVITGACLCYLDESFQRSVGRNFSYFDMLADVSGVLLAQGVYNLLARRLRKKAA